MINCQLHLLINAMSVPIAISALVNSVIVKMHANMAAGACRINMGNTDYESQITISSFLISTKK